MYALALIRAAKGKLNRGMIYITLGRLEEQGFIRAVEDPHPGHSGLPRSQYKLTGLGQRVLAVAEATRLDLAVRPAHV
jgi:DNA-binding PadR family transcriptional regulator